MHWEACFVTVKSHEMEIQPPARVEYAINAKLAFKQHCSRYTHSPMNSRAFKTKYISKTNTCPLRMFHSTITTLVVSRDGLDDL